MHLCISVSIGVKDYKSFQRDVSGDIIPCLVSSPATSRRCSELRLSMDRLVTPDNIFHARKTKWRNMIDSCQSPTPRSDAHRDEQRSPTELTAGRRRNELIDRSSNHVTSAGWRRQQRARRQEKLPGPHHIWKLAGPVKVRTQGCRVGARS